MQHTKCWLQHCNTVRLQHCYKLDSKPHIKNNTLLFIYTPIIAVLLFLTVVFENNWTRLTKEEKENIYVNKY